jgi:hypothetical protein
MIQKILVSPSGIKYKFGFQAHKLIKNNIKIDEKNENRFLEGSITVEIDQLTDKQVFNRLDSVGSNRLLENSLSNGF